MADGPKLHHYVPQFYLARFANANGKLWVWDKLADRSFQTAPSNIAVQKYFYQVDDVPDPLAMEKQLSQIEGNAARITEQWLYWLHHATPSTKIDIPDINRNEISLYLTTQYLRTAEQREILSLFAMDKDTEAIAADTKRALHINMLWDDEIIEIFRQRFYNAVWVFARNITEMPLGTSDNPIIFKTSDNRMWLKHGVLTKGTYAVFPISPTIVMYAYDGGFPRYASLRKFDCSLSPVSLTEGMIEQENTGQAFAAWRFVISPRNEFSAIRDFAETIGTDRYAPKT